VWGVHPQKKTIRIHRANGTVQDLRLADEPNGEEVIPGFVVRSAKSFDCRAKTAGPIRSIALLLT